jgi:hypothetical protein
MKNFLLIVFGLVMLSALSCKKPKHLDKATYTYQFNRSYTGSYPSRYYSMAILTATEKEDNALQLKVNLYGLNPTDSFSVHIHKKDLAEPFGYSGNPVIDIGTFKNGYPDLVKEISNMSYENFTNDFEGFFIVHDPANVQNDTTTLLFYGETGKVK